MRTIVITALLVCSLFGLTERLSAESRQPPYDAVIVDDDAYARSGPGKEYYPTSRFRKGDRVVVMRHDRGGWYMIQPPPGSFSWIRKEFVRHTGDRGVIISEGQVVVRAGTSFGDDHFVEQRRLRKGEEVEIIGEKTLNDERGDVAYFKIKPPAGEYRWIPGAKVIASDQQLAGGTKSRNADPFTNETESGHRVRDPNVAPVDLSQLESADETAPLESNPSSSPAKEVSRQVSQSKSLDDPSNESSPPARSGHESNSDSHFQTVTDSSGDESDLANRMRILDEQFQQMIRQDTRDWDFVGIEQGLRELQQHDEVSTAATRRLAQIDQYKQDYQEFQRITDETTRRDAELVEAQKAATTTMPARVPAPTPAATSRPMNARPGPAPQPNLLRQQPRPQRTLSPPRRTQPPSTGHGQPGRSVAPSQKTFNGAGIIQRSTSNQSGAPKHVLVHPDGHVLAYLQGDGVELEKYLGESMGLQGERAFRPDLQSDFMVVKSLQPVKLKP